MSIIVGKNGIINISKSANEISNEEKIKEQISLVYLSYQIKKSENVDFEIKEYFTQELGKAFDKDSLKVWVIEGKNKPIIRVDVNNKSSYIIYDDKLEKNESFKNENGIVYHKYEVYESTRNPGTKYQNCDKMIALECTSHVMHYPDSYASYMFSGCTSLKAIKLSVAKNTGHYVFSNLPSLEYLELGSIGHEWQGGGYFMAGGYYDGYTSRSFGTPVGLVIVAYMNNYNATARLFSRRTSS